MYNKLFDKKDRFFEMSNLTPDDTGLPFIIWISPKSGKESHWARVKVEYDNKLYSISIEDEPEWKTKKHIKVPFNAKQTRLISNFIKENKEILLSYWNSEGKMSMGVLLNTIIKSK